MENSYLQENQSLNKAETLNTFIKIFLHPNYINDNECVAWRLFLTKEREIDALPFGNALKTFQKEKLKKAKFGIVIDQIGTPDPLRSMKQIITGRFATVTSMWGSFITD